MVQGLISKQHSVFNENSAGSQDEGREQVDVDVVSGAAELSERSKNGQEGGKHTYTVYTNSTLYNQPLHQPIISCFMVKTHRRHFSLGAIESQARKQLAT